MKLQKVMNSTWLLAFALQSIILCHGKYYPLVLESIIDLSLHTPESAVAEFYQFDIVQTDKIDFVCQIPHVGQNILIHSF